MSELDRLADRTSCICGFCPGTLDTKAEILRESRCAAQRLTNRTIKSNSSSTFKNHYCSTAGKVAFLACREEQKSREGTLMLLPIEYMDKLANGVDSPRAVRTGNQWKWSYSRIETCSEEVQTTEYLILYAFLAGVYFTEYYSEPHVGPCHLLNLDTMSVKLVLKHTKWNSGFRRETASAFVTTTLSHRKLLSLFCENVPSLYKSKPKLNSTIQRLILPQVPVKMLILIGKGPEKPSLIRLFWVGIQSKL